MLDAKRLVLFLRLSCFFVLFGRSWQHLVWNAPYRSLFWDEGLMGPIVESLFGLSWNVYATSPAVDSWISSFIHGLGILYGLTAVLCLMPTRVLTRFSPILIVNAISLLILAMLYSKERTFQLGMAIEYAAQFLSPALLYMALRQQTERPAFSMTLNAAIVGTFVGHGLYAVGYYPVPGNFIDMTIQILGVKQAIAVQLLFFFGIIDLALAVGIFWRRTEVICLAYAAFWGFVTALARPLAFFDVHFPWTSLNQWLPEFIMRMPHALIPLAALALALQAGCRNRSRIFPFYAKDRV